MKENKAERRFGKGAGQTLASGWPAVARLNVRGRLKAFCLFLPYAIIYINRTRFIQRSSPTGRAEFKHYAHSAGPETQKKELKLDLGTSNFESGACDLPPKGSAK